ncbi:MAG TPA: hypothetical protein VL156_15755 [Terriglobales bacterium]|jgi:hypothetical protein|nr:hypothetical protein [Terriglobales bacterium]
MSTQPKMQRRLRIAGMLTGLGLLVQLSTFFGIHASAFMAFAIIGVPLTFAGCTLFLYSLVSNPK